MKKSYFYIPVFFCVLVIFQSCSKQSTNEMVAPVSPNIINAKIAPNQTYQLTLNYKENVSIAKQALHYKVSKAEPDAKTGQMTYEYVPAQDYTGTDEVVISSSKIVTTENSSGCNNNNDNTATTSYSTSYSTIRLTIAN